MTRRKKWDPERKKAAIEAIRNRKWAATERPEFSTYHKHHYRVMLKPGNAQAKQ